MNERHSAINTDRELWRETKDEYYSPSIHVTTFGGIGINVGGYVIVLPVRSWHKAAQKIETIDVKLPEWRRKIAWWLLGWKV